MTMKKTRIQGSRYPKRFDHDPEARNAILDEGIVCQVAFTIDNQPFILPTGYCRVDNILYLHGSVGSHFFMEMAKGIALCINVTLLDGLVLARSVFNHSMNYRSVVAFGKSRLVTDPQEAYTAAHRFTEHILPGRWDDARKPTEKEMKKTMFIAVEIEEASVKFRSHGVGDDPEDMQSEVWAGVLPLAMQASTLEADTEGVQGIEMPSYLMDYQRKKSNAV
jgi:uncharacterized protein